MVVFILNATAVKKIWKNTTLTQNIYDNVEIMADNITLDLNGYVVHGSDSGIGILIKHKCNVTVKDGLVENFDEGIRIDTSSYCTISSVDVSECRDGIYYAGSPEESHVYFDYCSASYCSGMGFALRRANSARLYDCFAWDIERDGLDENDSYDTWNRYFWASECTLNGLEVDGGTLHWSTYCNVSCNYRDGIDFENTTGNWLAYSDMNNNGRYGLYFHNSADYNDVSYCTGVDNVTFDLRDRCVGNDFIECNFEKKGN
jgi:parallel beta-helix repeat protein